MVLLDTLKNRLEYEQNLLRADEPVSDILFWESHKALAISGRDARLPQAEEAINAVSNSGWPVLTRKSGGSAFPVTSGVLNISILRNYPASVVHDADAKYISLTNWLMKALKPVGLSVSVGSTKNAVCDGRYNLMIDGKKFVGTSQQWHRRSDGSSRHLMHCAILVSADTKALVDVVNQFYSIADLNQRSMVLPHVHSNLCEYEPSLTVDSVAHLIAKVRYD